MGTLGTHQRNPDLRGIMQLKRRSDRVGRDEDKTERPAGSVNHLKDGLERPAANWLSLHRFEKESDHQLRRQPCSCPAGLGSLDARCHLP